MTIPSTSLDWSLPTPILRVEHSAPSNPLIDQGKQTDETNTIERQYCLSYRRVHCRRVRFGKAADQEGRCGAHFPPKADPPLADFSQLSNLGRVPIENRDPDSIDFINNGVGTRK